MKLTRKQWMMLVVLVLGAFVTVLNQTLVTPALPSIMTEMNVDQSTAQWLTTGFTLVNAIMIPITAFLQDRFSTRKLFVFSMSLFAVGTLLAAVGLNFPVLLGGRLVQAAGAGILMPVTMTVLMLVFPVDRRGSAMGIFGLGIACAPAIGPTVAGFVIDQADWHILFYLIFALSIVIIVPSLFLVDNKAPANKGDSVLDPLSLALSTLGFGLMLYGFSALGSAGFTLVPLLTTALGIVGVVWFFIRQTRLPRPMLRVDVLKKDGVEVIDPAGEAFDALEAQAVATVDDASVPDETVSEVYQRGYKMGTKVLRPAMVTVTSGGPKREKPQEDAEK